jgi:glycolate oxidase FAD binding subunit
MKISALPSEICRQVQDLKLWAEKNGAEIGLVAQATGLMTVTLKAGRDEAIVLIDDLRRKLRGQGGSVVALRIPEELRGALDVWGCDGNALPLMKEIKRRFDPNRILNPGRFVGNI